MAGNIKRMIDRIIEQRAKGNPLLIETTKAKLIFKGINPEAYSSLSPDNSSTESRIREIASDWGVFL